MDIYDFSCGGASFVTENAENEIKTDAALYADAVALIKERLSVPDGYAVMIFDEGAAGQYDRIAQSFIGDGYADYVTSGGASLAAYRTALKYGRANIAASSGGALPPFSSVPDISDLPREGAAYLFLCLDNGKNGTRFFDVPEGGHVPVFADATGVLFSEELDFSAFGLVFADAGPHLGCGELTVAVANRDVLAGLPADSGYLLCGTAGHTPSAEKLNALLQALNGFSLSDVCAATAEKSALLYGYLDSQFYYTAPIAAAHRSPLHVLFTTGKRANDERFCKNAEAQGLLGLAGGCAGGMCASLYGGMPKCGVEKLVAFMRAFAYENPKIEI